MAIKRHNPHACDAWQLLVKFSYTQNTQVSPLAAELELSPAQCHVLRLLEPDKPIPMRQLADGLCCDASNVTGLVDRLETQGLVERRPSPEDRRVKVLALTPAGSRLRGELLRHVAGEPHPLARLSAEERKTLVRILERLVEAGASGT
jgi:MarR family transcriptional regulator, organic hydroperoxide resistance regulator